MRYSGGAPGSGTAIIHDADRGGWLAFENPREVLIARSPAEVIPALARVEAAAGAGLYAAGFVSYEAAPAFDPALAVAGGDDFPLLWFGIYDPPCPIELPPPATATPLPAWQPGLGAAPFAAAVASIREHIARGETYQVNFTFPLTAVAPADPWNFFLALVQGQQAPYAAFLDTGRHVVCSASPELFFRRDGDRLRSSPMKGTAPRGLTAAGDRAQGRRLRASAKNRAENIMILDMVRNDLGRLGPVTVTGLCEVERYPTLWQLTSTAEARTDAPLPEVFAALFPCASITGAPKVQTMAIIRALEGRPRRLYTGAIGWAGPQRRACFSVAIRTALIDREAGRAEYGVGAGITWGSRSAAEYRECLDKARILREARPPFALLESLLWRPDGGYLLLARHLRRLAASARYFGVPCRPAALRRALLSLADGLPAEPHKVRLLVAADGAVATEAAPLGDAPAEPLRVRLAATPVDESDPFLYHKTTRRQAYDEARQRAAGADEVLLWNRRGELTEACNCNIVIQLNGVRLTPPVRCGLLAGTLREELLASGEIREGVIRREDLGRAEAVWLINSVRGWRRAEIIS